MDAQFDGRGLLANDLMLEATLEGGSPQVIYLDTNSNSTFALLPEDYRDDAMAIDLRRERMRIHGLTPVGRARCKMARLAHDEREDIRSLVKLGLAIAVEIGQRATFALAGYVGGQAALLLNRRAAVALARDAQRARRFAGAAGLQRVARDRPHGMGRLGAPFLPVLKKSSIKSAFNACQPGARGYQGDS